MKKFILILIICCFSTVLSFCQSPEKPFSNPILIYGSSFGNFFKVLYKQGQYGQMLKFTSSKSIKEYGKKEILDYYKSMDFGYDMKLRSQTIYNGIYTLNYSATIMGTNKVVRLDVVIENDTCKLVVNNTFFNFGINKESVLK